MRLARLHCGWKTDRRVWPLQAALVAAAVVVQTLIPLLQAWHAAGESRQCSGAHILCVGGPGVQGKAPASAPPRHRHDESSCPTCQSMSMAYHAGLIPVPTLVEARPEAELGLALAPPGPVALDPGLMRARSTRGPPV